MAYPLELHMAPSGAMYHPIRQPYFKNKEQEGYLYAPEMGDLHQLLEEYDKDPHYFDDLVHQERFLKVTLKLMGTHYFKIYKQLDRASLNPKQRNCIDILSRMVKLPDPVVLHMFQERFEQFDGQVHEYDFQKAIYDLDLVGPSTIDFIMKVLNKKSFSYLVLFVSILFGKLKCPPQKI